MLLERLVSFLTRIPPTADLLTRYQWWIVPHINPDGAERNRTWTTTTDGHYDVAAYLTRVVRELPGDDVEFAFPKDGNDHDARPENRAVYDWWRSDPEPFALHASMHGMAFGGGPWFLVEPDWVKRCGTVKEHCRDTTFRLGYTLHDVERYGDKGFVRIERGFATRPDSGAMTRHFVEINDLGTAAKFRPSSMETIRSLGGDPLTLVSEVPLFIVPGVGEQIEPTDPVADQWQLRLRKWQNRLFYGASADWARKEILKAGIKPVPIRDQLLLQWTMIQAGVLQVVGEETIQDAAVLVPVYRGDDGHLRLVLVRRTEGGVHGGQIAFPGGKWAPGDRSLKDTALREAVEEIGVVPQTTEIIEELPVVDTVTTGFRIHPYLARVDASIPWRREEREVAEILDVRVSDLLRPENHDEEMRRFADWPEPLLISFYKIGPYELWGATYRILQPLIERLVAGEWDV
jgi:8-oxo-dGTP pyrophosphatase MutT (NUDIX family)